jgi:hypothetical protein
MPYLYPLQDLVPRVIKVSSNTFEKEFKYGILCEFDRFTLPFKSWGSLNVFGFVHQIDHKLSVDI